MSHEQEIRVQEVAYAGAEFPCAFLKVFQYAGMRTPGLAEPQGFYLSVTYQSESIQEMETTWYVKQGKFNIKVLNY